MPTPAPRPLLLASGSRHRRQLLAKLGLFFESIAPDIDESARDHENPQSQALRLGEEKARALAHRFPNALILGSDQVAMLNGHQLQKPGGAVAAFGQLRAASGQCVDFFTSLCLLDAASGQLATDLDCTRVHFRTLEDEEIRNYIAREQPYDCAGSFKSEGLGIALLERLETEDPNALVGLPLIRLIGLLNRFGVKVL